MSALLSPPSLFGAGGTRNVMRGFVEVNGQEVVENGIEALAPQLGKPFPRMNGGEAFMFNEWLGIARLG